ncbi:thiamine pyrophosphate-dependent enzyme [Lentilactobacillus sp. SPB1-3]|uniref:Thiamine pyrophosphate-dependent enzyme n=1 Tax=Lentilactobacillus terminaliae TaxID=3003483 RepID=A0ACD5DDF0_9LACO|nr:thiamine pyrophosphate-dependent enzyme [Lentilactobacillus sp. SPB1-3]MCZ0977972.1 thiamine pyrophosphate-binding protein [Lentilactobacillus sp. SPB1-3]
MTKMTAGQALAKVLESWDVDHIYGITADSINNTVDGLYQERDHIKYIQVRHEEVGALAATADAKLTGKVGVSFGSAGPGATHLFNGLYDAKMDHAPVVAIIGQSATPIMNTYFFQEMDQDPMFADLTDFHKQATNPEQIPYIMDQAIRYAYQHKAPAVVIIPDNLSAEEIEYVPYKSANVINGVAKQVIDSQAVNDVYSMIKEAKHPVLWAGLGMKDAQEEVVTFSEKFSIPVLTTAPATGVIPTDHPNFMGSRGRLGTKPAFEVSQAADLIILAGTNYPFSRFLPQGIKFVQINNSLEDLGKQRDVDLAILADGKQFFQALNKIGEPIPTTPFLKAAQADKRNWDKWLDKIADDESEGLAPEAVIRAIKDNSADDAVFGLDVGNNLMWAIRQLPFNKQQKMTMSSWFGTMGYGLPAAIAGKLSYPDRQVFNIAGDGGFSMVMQDLLTQVQYEMPIINVVLENKAFGFIQHEKISANQDPYGINFIGADWAGFADSMGAIGLKVTDIASLNNAFTEIDQLQKSGNTKPIVIDAKIKNVDPADTSFMPIDPTQFDQETIDNFNRTANLFDQPALQDLLEE